MKEVLAASGVVGVLASEEDDAPILVPGASEDPSSYVAVFDPLDGSRNIEVSIPTGVLCSCSCGTPL